MVRKLAVFPRKIKLEILNPNVALTMLFSFQGALSLGIAWGWWPKLPLVLLLAILLTFVLLKALFELKRLPRLSLGEVVFYGLLTWVSFIQLVSYLDVGSSYPEEYQRTLGTTLVGAWAAAVAGYSLANLSLRYKLTVWVAQALTVWVGSYLGWKHLGQVFFLFYDPDNAHLTDFKTNYLLVGDMLAIASVIVLGELISLHKRGFSPLGFYWLSLWTLFLAFSRSSLVFGGTALTLFWLLGAWRLFRFLLAALIGIVSLAYLSLASGMQAVLVERVAVASGRIVALVEGTDASYSERLELLRGASEYLGRHWVLGKFLYEVTDGPGLGSYVHNWISFWLQFGVGPFALSIALIMYLFTKAVRAKADVEIALLVFAVLSLIFARAYVWIYYWFIMAYVLASLRRRKHRG